MPAPIPCPNPSCGQPLAVESIQGTGKVACPRCGTVLQFRSGTTPVAPRDPVPVARPVPAPPPVPPVLDPVDDDDEPEHDPALDFNRRGRRDDDEDEDRRRPRRRRSGGVSRFFVVFPIAMIFVTGSAFLIYLAVNYYWRNPEFLGEGSYVELENAYFQVLGNPWGKYKQDTERALKARGRMAVNYVACRSDPNDAVALFHRDYKNRQPTPGELVDLAIQKLRGDPNSPHPGYFTGVQWERVEGDHTLAGQKAIRLEFEGIDGENVECAGEAWLLAANGVGYWLFVWGPKPFRDELRPGWDELRTRFTLGTKRVGWTPTLYDPVKLDIPETPYKFEYPGGELWTLRQEVGWDPSAKVVLLSYERDLANRPPSPTRQHAAKMAVLQVLRLAPSTSGEAALEAAKENLLKQQKLESPAAKLEVLRDRKDQVEEGPARIGGLDGYLSRVEIIPEAGSRKRFFLLYAVADAEGVLVVQFDCPLDRRAYWESEFTGILNTLRRARS